MKTKQPKKPKLEQRSETIDILAKELQSKQRRLDKFYDKIFEQQDVLIHKNQRIAELKDQVASLQHDWNMCDSVCDNKQLEIQRLKRELKNRTH